MGAGSSKKTGYIRGLDGWRAIAILSVILFHDREHRFWVFSTHFVHIVGWAGVNLFFAISGLLICSRLLEEERIHGAISLSGFYVRRFFRIFPAAWLYLAVMAILGAIRMIPFSAPPEIAALLMVSNYYSVLNPGSSGGSFMAHFWTLSVEEHFYLILPALLVFVQRRVRVLTILSIVSFAWFVVFAKLKGSGPNLWWAGTDLQIHALLIAALLAVLLSEPENRQRAARLLQPWIFIPVAAVVLVVVAYTGAVARRTALVNLCFPLVVASTMLHPESLACTVLEWRPLKYIGRLSYGLYLWQQLFFIKMDGLPWPLNVLQQFPYDYISAALCTMASYYLLEKPVLAWGHKLAPPATPGRQDLREEPSGAAAPEKWPENPAEAGTVPLG